MHTPVVQRKTIQNNIEYNLTWELKNKRAEPHNRQFNKLFPQINEIFGSYLG